MLHAKRMMMKTTMMMTMTTLMTNDSEAHHNTGITTRPTNTDNNATDTAKRKRQKEHLAYNTLQCIELFTRILLAFTCQICDIHLSNSIHEFVQRLFPFRDVSIHKPIGEIVKVPQGR